MSEEEKKPTSIWEIIFVIFLLIVSISSFFNSQYKNSIDYEQKEEDAKEEKIRDQIMTEQYEEHLKEEQEISNQKQDELNMYQR